VRHVLPDVLGPNLKVVFCGSAAGTQSAQAGAYYAGRGNKFWPTLHMTGLTDRRLQPAEFRSVLEYDIGLTDLAKFASGADSTLKPSDFDVDRVRLQIVRHHPFALAFTSKKAGGTFLGGKRNYGLQPESVGRTRIYILPSPSGLASGHWAPRWWQQLADDARAT
jgi:TDG/mug DNA glycosylase family protein